MVSVIRTNALGVHHLGTIVAKRDGAQLVFDFLYAKVVDSPFKPQEIRLFDGESLLAGLGTEQLPEQIIVQRVNDYAELKMFFPIPAPFPGNWPPPSMPTLEKSM